MVSNEKANQDESLQQAESKPSPGAMLKARRESLGLTQQTVADKIFLKASLVNDLENDVIDEKSSVTFTKGYVRNYAKQIGLNPEEVIDVFERFHHQTAVPSSSKLQSFSKRVAKQTQDDRWMMVTYVILLLIVAGVVVWWYQQPADESAANVSLIDAIKQDTTSAIQNQTSNITAEIFPADADTTLSESSVFPQETAISSDENTLNTQVRIPQEESRAELTKLNASGDDSASVSQSGLDDSNNQTVLLNEKPTGDAINPEQINGALPIAMAFTFDQDCWVSIKDATGETIAFGVKQKGRIMEIQGVPPVEVTLGAPDNVRISVNGEPVNVSSYQNGKPTRFTLPM